MKLNLIRIVFTLAILAILSGCDTNPFQSKQSDLAKELGVKISDYHYESVFPEGYYATILKPGLSLKEVHSMIKGYEKVYHCKNYEEIYYYFSLEDQAAMLAAEINGGGRPE